MGSFKLAIVKKAHTTTLATTRKKPSAFKLGKKTNRVAVMKVRKQVHPELAISMKTMCMIDSICNDQFQALWMEAKNLAKRNGRKIITKNDMVTAVRLTYPGELAKHANSEGAKAWSK